ncbi:MAG: PhoH family protein [Gammaproteobacteria bacterium]|nr:PhoH family protein [Gammaproteobacteria bacterium]
MTKQIIEGKRIFVIDTNVLMHDPTAIFRFSEHNIYIPMTVLEELDAGKKGLSEVARNARQASRFIDQLMDHENLNIDDGLILDTMNWSETNEESAKPASGRLYFQTQEATNSLPSSLPGSKPDNSILSFAKELQSKYDDQTVTLISKDINMRIKAAILGLHVEDYNNDRVLDDIELLYTGIFELDTDFWENHGKHIDSWKEEGRTFYKINGPSVSKWYPRNCLFNGVDGENFQAIVQSVDPQEAIIEVARDYQNRNNSIWGINARNREQNFALNLLMDPDIDFISLQGTAGTGKTLLTLAAALEQTIEKKLYKEVVMTRVTVSVGEDIGFLPGTEEEKMTPWMGALMDNLEVLSPTDGQDEWRQAATQDLLSRWIKIRSLNFMRGRTFLNKFIIIDEAQNLTPKQMKTLITRAGPGTKVVCLGNVAQIDTPYLTETSSGITYVVDHFKDWQHSGHITLKIGERSRLADYASEIL